MHTDNLSKLWRKGFFHQDGKPRKAVPESYCICTCYLQSCFLKPFCVPVQRRSNLILKCRCDLSNVMQQGKQLKPLSRLLLYVRAPIGKKLICQKGPHRFRKPLVIQQRHHSRSVHRMRGKGQSHTAVLRIALCCDNLPSMIHGIPPQTLFPCLPSCKQCNIPPFWALYIQMYNLIKIYLLYISISLYVFY